MTMMRIRGVWTVNTSAFLIGAGMYSSFILFPEFTETPSSAGYGFGAIGDPGRPLPAALHDGDASGQPDRRAGSRAGSARGSTLIAGSLTTATGLHPGAPSPTTSRFDIYVATALLGVGIGLAFASLANLIVEAVPPSQTAVATGMNTVMRTLGGSVGGQVGASLIAGTVTAAALPTEQGFTLAFTLSAGACLVAAIASIAVPKPPRTATVLPWRQMPRRSRSAPT